MQNIKNSTYNGISIYIILSFLINGCLIIFFHKQAEYLSADLLHLFPSLSISFHLFPSLIFNGLVEMLSPLVSDILFLVPIAITDGVIGGVIGFFMGKYLRIQSKGKFNIFLIVSFIIFEWVDIRYIPMFTS